ncbi:MAG: phosphotransferase [Longimicrobiales bacterium]
MPLMDHTALVEAMREPGFYPHPVEAVDLVQTHVSSVFLTGELAYKLKKPVDFGFLDFSTTELRRLNCEKELLLNRRLAPRIYLRVAPISLVKGRPTLDGPGDPVDWVVVMRQLDQELLGPRVLETGRLTVARIDALVEVLVPFYEKARTGPEVSRWGRPEVFKFTTDENFEQTAGNVGEAISRSAYDLIRSFTDTFFETRRDLFERRIAEGRIRECHGDLHLGNIFFLDEPVVFDCIEFNDRLSCTDVAADLGFLAMDLEFRGKPELAQRVIDRFVEGSGDLDLPEIVVFYSCYRAYVRGKIACFTAADPALDEGARRDQIQLASRYFNLALRYALGGAGP